MENEKKEKIIQIIIGTILLIIAVIIDKLTNLPIYIDLLIYLVPYFVVGFEVFKESFEAITEGNIFNENFLMSIATIGALLIGFLPNSEPEFLEAVFVMLFFQVGELFEIIAEGNSKKSINSLLEIRPDYALVIRNKKVIKVDPNSVSVGETITINPGDKIPMDGIILEGKSNLNTVAITGESIPRKVEVNDTVISGCINLTGKLNVKVTKTFGESTASKIIDLVENATESKSSSDKFITKFAKIYTPIVVILALLLAIIPSIVTGNYVTWIRRSLTFLVISCPCALVISVPLSYFGGIGSAAKKGILIKGANHLESLSKLNTIAFDKTGTLTEGVFEVVAIHPSLYDEEKLLHLSYHVEENSNHPIAVSLKEYYSKIKTKKDTCKITEVEELSGLGVKAKVNSDIIYVGNIKLMQKIKANVPECDDFGTIIHIAMKNKYLGHIVISDKIKDDTKKALTELNNMNINTIMLTGDNEKCAKHIANELKINNYYAELMPIDKVTKIEEAIDNKKSEKDIVAFVGDGINDAPVIARSDLGISMGGIASDAAIESSDIVIMNDSLANIITGIKISKKTSKIAYQNIYFAIIVKLIVLILSAFGLTPMYLAVFADVGVTLLAILNAMRTLK